MLSASFTAYLRLFSAGFVFVDADGQDIDARLVRFERGLEGCRLENALNGVVSIEGSEADVIFPGYGVYRDGSFIDIPFGCGFDRAEPVLLLCHKRDAAQVILDGPCVIGQQSRLIRWGGLRLTVETVRLNELTVVKQSYFADAAAAVARDPVLNGDLAVSRAGRHMDKLDRRRGILERLFQICGRKRGNIFTPQFCLDNIRTVEDVVKLVQAEYLIALPDIEVRGTVARGVEISPPG